MTGEEKASLCDVLAPIEQARGLPNAHYTDHETFAREREALFFNQWAAIGFAKDVPVAGDAAPMDFMGMPLLLVRAKDDAVRVFQNTCRHRGMILVSEPTRIRGPIRCPYHSWCYDFDGRLINTPQVGGAGVDEHEAINKDDLGLFEIRSHVWRDIVFVNVSGDAPDFLKATKELQLRWRAFDCPLFHGGSTSTLTLEVACNWKLAVENYCESYHLPWVHPALNTYSRIEDHYPIDDGANYAGQGTVVYQQLVDENGGNFPDFPGLPEKWDKDAEYIALFPNVLLGVHRDHAFAMILTPQGPERTFERVELYYAREDITAGRWGAMLDANSNLWRTVFAEDVGVIEGMQRGRHGVKFDGGKFSPAMDGPTHAFHKWVAEQLSQPEEIC